MRGTGQLAGVRGPSVAGDGDERLDALREISRVLLVSERVESALQTALERVSPLVGASFASVYLCGGEDDLMRLAASHNWPERWRPWLGAVRVRLGFGPSGEAASERRAVEIADVFADPALVDWHDVAAELGFRALFALPLTVGARSLGAVTFYFAASGGLASAERELLHTVADQMALAADRSAALTHARRALERSAAAETEAERQRMAALEARRVRDEFLANVSHELRTPLTVVLGTIDLLSEEFAGPLTDAQRDDLDRAREASTRLLSLIESLLALSSARQGTLTLAMEEFDPRVPLREAVRLIGQPPATARLVVDEPGTFLPPMRGDLEKMTRILLSLLSNAFKFAPNGDIVASMTVSGGRVRYRVIDCGPGIPAEAQELVFDEFRQLDGSLTRRVGGAGLGLPLARALARFVGGDVTLVAGRRQGAEFVVDVPLEQAVRTSVVGTREMHALPAGEDLPGGANAPRAGGCA